MARPCTAPPAAGLSGPMLGLSGPMLGHLWPAAGPTPQLRTPRLVGGRWGSQAPLLTPDVRTGAARSSTAPTRTVGAAWRRRRAALRPQPAARWGSLAPSTSCTAAPTGRAVGAARATRSRWPGPQPAGFGLPDLSGAVGARQRRRRDRRQPYQARCTVLLTLSRRTSAMVRRREVQRLGRPGRPGRAGQALNRPASDSPTCRGRCTVLLTLSRRTSAMVRRREGSPATFLTPDVRTGATTSAANPTRGVSDDCFWKNTPRGGHTPRARSYRERTFAYGHPPQETRILTRRDGTSSRRVGTVTRRRAGGRGPQPCGPPGRPGPRARPGRRVAPSS